MLYGILNSMSCMQYFKRPFAVYDSRKVWTQLHLHNPNWGYILIPHTRCPRVFANSLVLQNITQNITCTSCNYFAQILSHPYQFAHSILIMKNFFGNFWAYVGQPHDHIGWAPSMPFASINPTNPRTNPWNFHEKILRIDEALKMTFV